VLAVPPLIEQCKFSFPAHCVLTDVGSTKAQIVREATRILDDVPAVFVGSHPIAGSEATGLDAARTKLFENAVVVVTPADEQDAGPLSVVRKFWEKLGSRVTVMRPEEHDGVVARTSHLPHLVAAMLVKSVFRDRQSQVEGFCGTGFMDTTRIAGGSEDVWHDIVKSNSAAVRWELEEFDKVVESIKKLLSADDFEGIRRFLAESGNIRRDMKKDGL
jgi:prephenate dehydrogenase